MPSKLKYGTVPVTLICLSYLPTAQNASAVSVENAKTMWDSNRYGLSASRAWQSCGGSHHWISPRCPKLF